MTEANKQLIARFYEAFARKDGDAMAAGYMRPMSPSPILSFLTCAVRRPRDVEDADLRQGRPADPPFGARPARASMPTKADDRRRLERLDQLENELVMPLREHDAPPEAERGYVSCVSLDGGGWPSEPVVKAARHSRLD